MLFIRNCPKFENNHKIYIDIAKNKFEVERNISKLSVIEVSITHAEVI